MARDKIKSDPIDGFVYEVHQLTATQGEEIGAELVAMVLPVIGAVAGDGNKQVDLDLDKDLDWRSLGLRAGAELFSTQLTSPRLREIRAIMAKHTDIYGEGFGDSGAPLSRQYDDHFAGRYDAMLEWFMFALEVNFSGFFVGLWERAAKRYPLLQALPAVLSNPQNTSTGGSGGSSSQE